LKISSLKSRFGFFDCIAIPIAGLNLFMGFGA
jgi:hypothetical protein